MIIMDYELNAKQLGFESYDELKMYYDMAYVKKGFFNVTKDACIEQIKIERGEEFLNKPRNEQLYEMMADDINVIEELQNYHLGDQELEDSFSILEYHIQELKKYHLNLEKNKSR